MAKSDLAEARAELSRERKRRVAARAARQAANSHKVKCHRRRRRARTGLSLFSDDNGAVSPLRLDIPPHWTRSRPSAAEATARGHRGHAEGFVEENAASDKQERQREVKRLRDRRTRATNGVGSGPAGEARRIAGARRRGEGCRASGPAGAGAVRRRGARETINKSHSRTDAQE